MPKKYEAIRDKCAGKAKKDSPKYNECQTKAAKIYNATRKKGQKPVTGTMKKACGGAVKKMAKGGCAKGKK